MFFSIIAALNPLPGSLARCSSSGSDPSNPGFPASTWERGIGGTRGGIAGSTAVRGAPGAGCREYFGVGGIRYQTVGSIAAWRAPGTRQKGVLRRGGSRYQTVGSTEA